MSHKSKVSEQRLFKAQFIIHDGHNELKLAQTSMENSEWINCDNHLSEISIDEGVNSLRIVVGEQWFEVYINGKIYPSCVRVSSARLQQFTAIQLWSKYSTCFSPIPSSIQIHHKKGQYHISGSKI